MHRVTDPVVVAVCAKGISWFPSRLIYILPVIYFVLFEGILPLSAKHFKWYLCGGCQWKENPGVANPKIKLILS